MSNRICALIWFIAAAAAAAAAFIIFKSNLVFALCFVGVAVAFLAISASCLLRDPPAKDERKSLEETATGNEQHRRKWYPR